MTTFYLIRHAEKATGDRLSGRTLGVHLSTRGAAQAEKLAQLLAPVRFERVAVSPIERAQETAVPLVRTQGLTIETDPALIEMDLGEWTARTPDELDAVDAWRRFNRFRSATRVPGGETMLEMQARFVGAMLRWRDAAPDATVALISHAEPIRAAVAFFAGTPLDLWARFEIDLASYSVLTLGRDHAQLLRLNVTADTPA